MTKTLTPPRWVIAAFVTALCCSVVAQEYGSSNQMGNEMGNSRSSRNRSSRSSRSSLSNSQTSGDGQRTDQDNARDTRRRESTRSRNSNLRGGSASKQPADKGQAQGAAAGKQTKTVQGKQPPKKTAASSSGGGAGRATTNVEFKMKADPSANILLLESADTAPTMNILATQGKKFVTRVLFRNARKSAFKQVDVAIKFDPRILQPVGIDDEAFGQYLAAPATAKIDSRRGIVVYKAELREPQSQDMATLFKLEWKALSPTTISAINFINTPDHPTRIMKNDVNVLLPADEDAQLDASENSGLLGATVAVVPDAKTAADIGEADDIMTAMQLINAIGKETAEGGVMLSLRPRQTQVTVGSDFLVDIVYSNPKRAEIDMVKLKIRFDPKALQVVDHDMDNWITRGTNIFDGDYHEDLPFDYHLRNQAYNNTGLIVYEMGFTGRNKIPSSGTIATIRFRAAAPAPFTEVAFDYDENETVARTAVSFLGFNLIGKPGERAAALSNAQLSLSQ